MRTSKGKLTMSATQSLFAKPTRAVKVEELPTAVPGRYAIFGYQTSQVLAVSQAGTSNGDWIISYNWQDGNEQKFNLTNTDDGYTQLMNVNSLLVIAISQGHTDPGSYVIQYQNQFGPEQEWVLSVVEGTNPQSWSIQNRNSGLYLTMEGFGNQCSQTPWVGAPSQIFTFESVT
jgi:Ricin-type beta-trefoil lectin domain-like